VNHPELSLESRITTICQDFQPSINIKDKVKIWNDCCVSLSVLTLYVPYTVACVDDNGNHHFMSLSTIRDCQSQCPFYWSSPGANAQGNLMLPNMSPLTGVYSVSSIFHHQEILTWGVNKSYLDIKRATMLSIHGIPLPPCWQNSAAVLNNSLHYPPSCLHSITMQKTWRWCTHHGKHQWCHLFLFARCSSYCSTHYNYARVIGSDKQIQLWRYAPFLDSNDN
jgi:hypothetical protein